MPVRTDGWRQRSKRNEVIQYHVLRRQSALALLSSSHTPLLKKSHKRLHFLLSSLNPPTPCLSEFPLETGLTWARQAGKQCWPGKHRTMLCSMLAAAENTHRSKQMAAEEADRLTEENCWGYPTWEFSQAEREEKSEPTLDLCWYTKRIYTESFLFFSDIPFTIKVKCLQRCKSTPVQTHFAFRNNLLCVKLKVAGSWYQKRCRSLIARRKHVIQQELQLFHKVLTMIWEQRHVPYKTTDFTSSNTYILYITCWSLLVACTMCYWYWQCFYWGNTFTKGNVKSLALVNDIWNNPMISRTYSISLVIIQDEMYGPWTPVSLTAWRWISTLYVLVQHFLHALVQSNSHFTVLKHGTTSSTHKSLQKLTRFSEPQIKQKKKDWVECYKLLENCW